MKEVFSENSLEQKFPEGIYYIESDQDDSVLLAIDIIIDGNFIKWFDGTKERVMRIQDKIQNNDGSFSFERGDGDSGAMYNLTKMTLSVYNENVKNKLSLPEEFDNEEDMLESFQSTIDSAW